MVCTGQYTLFLQDRGLPSMADEYIKRATLSEEFDSDDDHCDTCFIAVAHSRHDWPFLTITQQFAPSGRGFEPGAILIPETNRLLIGAGTRLLAYNLETIERQWEDMADTGFWSWSRHKNTIIMSAELEMAAWDLSGKKLWSTFVEPPWNYDVVGNAVTLDVMGVKSTFDLVDGPTKKGG